MTTIQLPNHWRPRRHQMGIWNAMREGIRRAVLIWHRRAGKDSFSINFLCTEAMTTPGVYWHMLPTATQGRKVVWDNIDYYGRRVIDQAFPHAIRKRTNDNEMKIELINGSIFQVVGSDNFDSLVGANPRGVIFSEFSVANPRAWDFLRPILRENGGFAIFIYTPRGHNHGYRLYHNATDQWYKQILTVEDTYRDDGVTPIVTAEDIEEERRSGMSEEMIQQEFYCSFEGGFEGAYFTNEVNDIRKHRLVHVPNDPYSFAMTAWDLGVQDKTAIGVFKRHPENGHPVLMDAYEDRNKGLPHYISHVKSLPYNYHYHFGPHDLNKRDFVTLRTVADRAADLGIMFDVVPRDDLISGIDELRAFLKVLYVNDCPNNHHVLDMVGSYRREFDDKNQMFKDKPMHDYASDTTDMMRYAAQSWDPSLLERRTAHAIKCKRAIR